MYIHFGQESSRDKAGQKAHGRQQAHSLGLNISTGIVGCVLKTVQKQCEKGLDDLGRPMCEVHVFFPVSSLDARKKRQEGHAIESIHRTSPCSQVPVRSGRCYYEISN